MNVWLWHSTRQSESSCETSQMFVPLRDLWWNYSCFDFETYGATVDEAWVFSSPLVASGVPEHETEVGAGQYQPMISWERKRAVINVPEIQFIKSFWTNTWKQKGVDLHWSSCLVSSGIPAIVSTPSTTSPSQLWNKEIRNVCASCCIIT